MVKDKIILITGGNTGIGAAAARLLAKNGARVIINHRDSEGAANKLAAEINLQNKNDSASTVKADVSDENQVKDMISIIMKKYGRIDVIVNNASPKTFPKSVSDTDWKDMQKHLNTTLKGAYNVIKNALPQMISRKNGNIINVLTTYTIGMPPPKLAPYVTAKYALEGFSKSLAAELGAHGIRVNMVSPGITQTVFIEHLPAKLVEIIAAQTPLRKIATPEDVAKVVLFLASENSAHLTGVNIPVCGGHTTL